MRSVELLVVGFMLLAVALVPPGWQDARFARFLPGGRPSLTSRPNPRRRFRLLTLACLLAGGLFLVAGIHSML